MRNKKIMILLILLLFTISFVLISNSLKPENLENEIGQEVEDESLKTDEEKAYQKLQTLTMDEKIGQIFLVRYPVNDAIDSLKKYHLGGYLLFEKDFLYKSESKVKEMIQNLQENANIPLLIAVDEEGGNVVRVSSNPELSKTKFLSPSELYQEGGFEKIAEDTIQKSKVLGNLGINLNLAPVVDVATNPADYMYERTLKEGTELTSLYARTVIRASKGLSVSYTLKHFPGYNDNQDTHVGESFDNRSYEDILKNDIPPFQAGIEEGAEAVLISHNVVTSIDKEKPASLSLKVHKILREDLDFTGVIITDNLDMQAVSNKEDVIKQAILAGNDILIVTDYKESIEEVKRLIEEKEILQERLDEMVFHILTWKYQKGLM